MSNRNPIYKKLINSTRWRLLRAEKMRANPLCEECDANGRSTLATEVHHITPVESVPYEKDMERLMFSYSNLRSLCSDCHHTVHKEMFSQTKEAIQANNRRATERFAEKFLK